MYARCPKCNAKVKISSRYWDVKQQAYFAKPSWGGHTPGNKSYEPAYCDMSHKLFKGELISA